ncbi:hypothetical protein D0Z03_000590 [Geotrichum reessii]|nr:hypothetical protein D0Z03_000590 [Galactomyces reessii]
MGKSLRSKSKLKFRSIKRATGVFGKADKERAERLAAKLGTLAKNHLKESKDEEEEDTVTKGGEDVSMDQTEGVADQGKFAKNKNLLL